MARVISDDSEESEREVNDDLSDWERESQQAQVRAPAKRLLFRDENNFPIGFVLHKSLNNDEKRVLTKDIEKHGGIVLDLEEERSADTLLINAHCGPDLKSTLQLAYHGHGDPSLSKIRVEFATFIRRCIKNRVFKHSVPQIKAMGGIPVRCSRNEFTAGDDEMLCWFLSRLMPEKEAGGRLGLKVYQKLVDCADVMPQAYAWAKRHTAESWKQRYKTHRDEFDARIEELMIEEPPRDDQKWPEDRRMTKEAIKKRRRQYDSDDSWEEREPSERSDAERQEESDSEVEIVMVSQKKRNHSGGQSIPRSANKKQRMLQHPQRQERSQITTNKGKEKAIEIEDEEQAVQEQSDPNSLFDGDISHFDFDPPAPIDLRSPDRTLVASSRSNPPNAPATQTTLIASSSRTEGPMSISRARDPGPSNRSPQPINQPVWLSSSTLSNPVQALQSSPHRPPVDSPQLTPPPPAQRPPTASQLPKKAARRRPPVAAPVVEFSAPYRNTRQRSRSAEPQPQAVQKPRKKLKQVGPIPEESHDEVEIVQTVRPVRASARLRSIEPEKKSLSPPRRNARKRAETIPEEREEDKHINENEPPIGETLAEEMDVANLLTQGTLDRGLALNRRGPSMDTDDAYVERNLRAGSVSSQVKPLSGFNLLERPPSDILKRFEAASSRRHSMLPTSSNHPTPNHSRGPQLSSRKPRQSAPSRLRNDNIPGFQLPNPRTPLRQEQERSSSIESFPASGTRARAFLEVLTQHEKGTPYRPPEGTRAAQMMADAL